MNLKEILLRKKLLHQEEKALLSSSLESSKKEAEKGLLAFFLLLSKFYSRDLRIGYGPDFENLLHFLTDSYSFKERDYKELDFGLTIKGDYFFRVINVPTNVVYSLYKNFLFAQKSEKS